MFGDFRDEVGLLALSKTPSRAQVGYPGGTSVKKKKKLTCQCRRSKRHAGSILGAGRSPGNPLQYSCLENPIDKGVWWATVHGTTKSWAQLSVCTHTHTDLNIFKAPFLYSVSK